VRRSTWAALAVLGLLVALFAALPAGASASNGSYVALGDSYTSAPGVLPVDPEAPEKCGRSLNNYPHLVAAALELTLTDVSCGGAQTKDEESSQFEGQPPQFEALTPTTEIVTLGMGGNDNNVFGTLLQGCTETDIKHEENHACREAFSAFVTKAFAEDKAPQEAALKKIKELSPKATVFVIGYPDIAPANGMCGPNFPWHPGDLKWFRNKVERAGNKMQRAGAKANGAIFVETFAPSVGHDACQEPGVRWIEPVFGSLTGVAVHPNLLGEEHDAVDVEAVMMKHGIK
jgi:hypothetical protein